MFWPCLSPLRISTRIRILLNLFINIFTDFTKKFTNLIISSVQTKLDLARAFLDLGDAEGARGILEEVVAEGNERQREEAESLLSNTG